MWQRKPILDHEKIKTKICVTISETKSAAGKCGIYILTGGKSLNKFFLSTSAKTTATTSVKCSIK